MVVHGCSNILIYYFLVFEASAGCLIEPLEWSSGPTIKRKTAGAGRNVTRYLMKHNGWKLLHGLSIGFTKSLTHPGLAPQTNKEQLPSASFRDSRFEAA